MEIKDPNFASSIHHFIHNQLVGGRQRWLVTTAGALRLLPKIERGLSAERARLGTFRGFGIERARLGTFNHFAN